MDKPVWMQEVEKYIKQLTGSTIKVEPQIDIEEHCGASIGLGSFDLTSDDGEVIELTYSKHIPAVYYLRNGDPGYPADVDVTTIKEWNVTKHDINTPFPYWDLALELVQFFIKEHLQLGMESIGEELWAKQQQVWEKDERD